ncbi:uncharacterized protein VTP21DRAFT_10865 [Calcarisporiella thermophila]|uniref:uncharacterized protein n=1 Tax=Calcarisporiella thermophila TaxID=911321 RepID=UPI0037443574
MEEALKNIGQTIDQNRIVFTEVLGVGAYGVVYRAKFTSPSIPPRWLAVKCLNNRGLDSRQRHFQFREITLHTQVSSHPNILTLEKVIETDDLIYVVLEYCDEGDLFSAIVDRGKYTGNDALVKKVFLQILDAVMYCHKRGVYHRDLKPENIMVFSGCQVVKLADFGLATTQRYSTEFGCGSLFYQSPECLGGLDRRLQNYETPPNDIWSLGIILVNLIAGRNPWKQATLADPTFRAFLRDPNVLGAILPLSFEAVSVLKRVFEIDPKLRVGLGELKDQIMGMRSFRRAIPIPRPIMPVVAGSGVGMGCRGGSKNSTTTTSGSPSQSCTVSVEPVQKNKNLLVLGG